jgi:hypothetical protein
VSSRRDRVERNFEVGSEGCLRLPGGRLWHCKMRLISGRVEHGRCSAAVLLEEEKENGSFLSCQARALSDLTVELTAANKYRWPMAAWQWLGRSDS